MNKPRVFIVTPGTFAIPSKRSSSVETVVDQMTRQLSNKADFVVFGKKLKQLPAEEVRNGITYIRPANTQKNGYLQEVQRSVRIHRPTLIQIENRPRSLKYLKKRNPRIHAWLSLHSTTFISPPHIRRAELHSCLRHADKIIVNSRFLKQYVTRRFPDMKNKVDINYLGVDTKQFTSRWREEGQALSNRLKQSLGYENKKIIMYVGRLQKIKGVHHLLEAMPAVISTIPEAMLVIVGSAYYGSNRSTPYVRSLHAMGKRMKDNIKFVSYVPHSEIHRWFMIADVVAVPSFNKEAFGLVNVEAMAMGVPVLASNAGGMKEIIEHGKTGFLLNPKEIRSELINKITLLLSDEDLCRQMGEHCVSRVANKFTWQHSANRMLSLYLQ